MAKSEGYAIVPITIKTNTLSPSESCSTIKTETARSTGIPDRLNSQIPL